MVWYGVVLCGMVWYDMIWCGMVLYGMVWYGMVCCGTVELKREMLTLPQVSSDWWRGNVGGKEGLIPDKYILLKIRGEDEARDSLASISEDRRRATSTSDTLRSTRSETSQSPRVARSHHSVSTPSPATPPLARMPHRHSISHAPPSLEASARPRGTVIAVTTPPQPATRPRTASRESAGDRDSGNPSPDVTAGSGRASRSPALQGSEGSMEFDSLSVDDSVEETSVGNTAASALATAATTVIHVTGNSVSRIRCFDTHYVP